MKTITHSIEVNADPMTIWSVLTDRDQLAEWNPFLRSIDGDLVPGARIRVRIHPPGGRAMTFRPEVLEVQPGRRLRWLGRLVLPGLLDRMTSGWKRLTTVALDSPRRNDSPACWYRCLGGC